MAATRSAPRKKSVSDGSVLSISTQEVAKEVKEEAKAALLQVKEDIKKEETNGPALNAFGEATVPAPPPLPAIPEAPPMPLNMKQKPGRTGHAVAQDQGTIRRAEDLTTSDVDGPGTIRRTGSRSRPVAFMEKFSLKDTEMVALPEGKFSIIEWARKHFRLDSPGLIGTFKRRSRDRASLDAEQAQTKAAMELVKWTPRPIKVTLNRVATDENRMNKYAEESFRCIMRLMGDHRPGSKTEPELVHIILKLGMANTILADEVFCQLIRQLTNNRSPNKLSLVKGWSLCLLLASFVSVSPEFFPFLRKYVHEVANDATRSFSSTALIVEKTLLKVAKHGGRKVLPEPPEINAILNSKHTRLQKIHFPSGISKTIKVNVATTVSDILKDLCCNKLHLTMEGAADYGLFVHPTLEFGTPLQLTDFILDSTTILEKRKMAYRIYFRKVIWFDMDPLNDLSLCTFLFDQINHQFQQGLLIQQKQVTKSFLSLDVARLICVRLKLMNFQDAKGPSRDDPRFLAFVPRDIGAFAPQEVWVEKICAMWESEFKDLGTQECFRIFLSTVRTWPLYGGTFFRIQSVSDPRIQGACIMNVDAKGVHFLHLQTKEEIFSFNYEDIVSTRRLGSRTTDQHFIDFKVGNLMVQRVTRCQTNHSLDLVTVVEKYKELYMDAFSQGDSPESVTE